MRSEAYDPTEQPDEMKRAEVRYASEILCGQFRGEVRFNVGDGSLDLLMLNVEVPRMGSRVSVCDATAMMRAVARFSK
jgi:hypothetical protein